MTAVVLAHQGGWDEILLVLTPIALFAGLLWLANHRANAQQQAGRTPAPPAASPPDPGSEPEPEP